MDMNRRAVTVMKLLRIPKLILLQVTYKILSAGVIFNPCAIVCSGKLNSEPAGRPDRVVNM